MAHYEDTRVGRVRSMEYDEDTRVGRVRSMEYDEDTRVEPVSPGVYAATLTDRWNALGGGTNGGYTLGVCVNALAQTLPHPDPLVVSAYFLRRGRPGPAQIHTDTARSGRRVASGEARLTQDGQEIVRAVATFTDHSQQQGRTHVLSQPPDLPPPDQAEDLMLGRTLPGVTIADRIHYRARELPGWAKGEPGGDPSMEFWMRFADGRDADTLALPMLVDAAAPAVLDLGVPGSATLELTVHVRARPAPGWLACRVSTRHVIGGFHEEDFEIWDYEGRLVAQSRQLGLLPE